MAESLKRDYDIIVLKAELLDGTRDGADLRFTLQYKVEGRLEDRHVWMACTGELGFTGQWDSRTSLGQGLPIQLPPDLRTGLTDFIQWETEGDRPLWVHLVKPYGVLRFVPWERLLGEPLGVPILMLPDFLFPPPRETRSVLEVVLCGSAPLGREGTSVQNGVRLAVDRILESAVRRTRVHVFVDRDIADPLRDEWKSSGRLDGTVLLHDHSVAGKYAFEDDSSRLLDRTGSIRSPWLLWMREALRGRSVDVLHFVCHGYVSRDRGAMLFAQSPLERTERFLAGPVVAPELHTFLTQVGAWSTVFTSLEDNNSEPGLRALADEIAQSRPGPLMMHTMREDKEASALGAGYRFLYSFDPEPPPRSRALFIYCQPYRTTDATRARRRGGGPAEVRGPVLDVARNDQQREAVDRAGDQSPLDPLFEKDENVSSLVASTERFAEQVQLRYQQMARDELLPTGQRDRDMSIAHDTIRKLREAVAEVAGDAGAGGAGGA